jgi:Holliday junction resolvasome RuvABC endonuclease subunit
MVVLGLDVSTTTIGYAYIKNKKILDMGFIDISKHDTFKDKAYHAMGILDDNPNMEKTDKIIVEDSLSGFMNGRTRMQTIIKLAKFNAVFCFVMEWRHDVDVELINPNTARKAVFGKARVKGKSAKEYVKEQVDKKFKPNGFIKMNKRGNPDRRNIDAYDALVCAFSQLKI